MKKREKKEGFEDGYISFTLDQLNVDATSDAANAEAYEWLGKAMKVSADGTKKDAEDPYPTTAEQTEQMRECLSQAERSATNPTAPLFVQRLKELRSIVEWSSIRHYTYSWGLIGGVIIIVAAIFFLKADAAKGVDDAKARKEMVYAWKTDRDTTFVYETITKADNARRHQSSIHYKHYELYRAKERAESASASALKYTQQADTASVADRKKLYLKRAEEQKKRHEEYVEHFNEVNEMNHKKVHKYAKSKAKSYLSSARSSNRFAFVVTALFVLLIPAYILSQRPYGYMITRLRFESQLVGGIQKFFFAIAGGMATLSMLVPEAPVTVPKWSDGTKTRDQNSSLAAALMAIKFTLLAIAICIICGVSFALMIYLTVQGLRRNYNWGEVRAKAEGYAEQGKDYIEKGKAKIEEQQNK
ncbi:MAG: hypothetical protein SNH88_06410 [Rikenellaceae bacterium]